MLGRPDDVRSSGKTGSGRHLAKLTRLTQCRHWPESNLGYKPRKKCRYFRRAMSYSRDYSLDP